ncbi:MAG: DNA repair protein RecO [Pseudorhodobacter sp.]|nr:DNA repair protein RecO [Pseudorhodobacter sp.]
MEWRDEGTILALRAHGETSVIIEAFTVEHGRHAGVVRGGVSRKQAATLQPGSFVALEWRARLEDHLGVFLVEPLRSRAGVLGDRLALLGLNAVCALLSFALPEREPHPAIFGTSETLLDQLAVRAPGWPLAYLRWELALLEELGYGLDLRTCAVTGARDDLCYVSPKTGRAISREGAGKWAARLLPLPACLMGQGPADAAELAEGFVTTGFFLEHRLARGLGGRALPEARRRLVDALARATPAAGAR